LLIFKAINIITTLTRIIFGVVGGNLRMELNELEILILRDIVEYQKRINGLNLERQLESLQVKNRKYTGFGIYVYFEQKNQADFTQMIGDEKKYLSSPIEIYLDTLEYQISFDLNLNEKGQFDFLEIVPNGVDNWNGKYEKIKTTANNGYK